MNKRTKEKQKDIRFILIFVAVLSISLVYLFQSSYAKYRKQISTKAELDIADWRIKINNEDIRNKSILTNNIVPVFDTNANANEGVIAPGTTGHFDIVIDATKVDVNFNYELTPDLTTLNVKDLKITSYEINSTNTTYSNTPITGSINHNTAKTTIRLNFEWDDSATNQMDNAEDTEVGSNNLSEADILVSIKFTQKNN